MHLKPYRPYWCRKYFAPGAGVPLCYIVSISGMKHHRKTKVISTESLSRVETPSAIIFLPRKFCLVYKKYFHQKLGKQITIETVTTASWAKRRWKGLRETHLRSKRKFRSELKYQDMVRPKFKIEHAHIFGSQNRHTSLIVPMPGRSTSQRHAEGTVKI